MHTRPEPPSTPAKTLVALSVSVCVVALACGACGRRGPLEPPGGAVPERSAATAPASPRTLQQGIGLSSGTAPSDPDAVRAGEELPVSATPAGTDTGASVQTERGAKRGYRIPKGPFILDPIL